MTIPVFFHERQLAHRPLYEWAFGTKLDHPESSRRAEKIHAALAADPATFSIQAPTVVPTALIQATHDPRIIELYRAAEKRLAPEESLSPSVFPRRSQTVADPRDLHKTGYFCFDSGTPLTSATWEAACWSAACAQEAARLVESGASKIAYGLCRPPGHHASRDLFGGYCYFNNAAIVAKGLRRKAKVAILDIDFHHGNGTQQIFYRDDRVLFVSLHGAPEDFYPYFSGFAAEKGAGKGEGFTLNLPLPRGCDGQEYLRVLSRSALSAVADFCPSFLVVSAGLDTFRGDPIGAFTLDTPDFHALGDRIGRLGIPVIALQEGGYGVDDLGVNVATFLRGLRDGLAASGMVRPTG